MCGDKQPEVVPERKPMLGRAMWDGVIHISRRANRLFGPHLPLTDSTGVFPL